MKMRNYLVFFLLILNQNVFCQDYKFDKYYEYNINESGSEFFLINSKDTTYSFVGRSFNKEITGYIEDLNKNLHHHYNVQNKKSAIEFEYIKSTIYKKSDLSLCEFNYYDLVKTRKDSTKSKINLGIYKNAKKKRIAFKMEIVISELDTLFLSKNMFCNFYNVRFPNKLDLSLTNLPVSINFKNLGNGYKTSKKLIKNKNINTTLYLKEEAIKIN